MTSGNSLSTVLSFPEHMVYFNMDSRSTAYCSLMEELNKSEFRCLQKWGTVKDNLKIHIDSKPPKYFSQRLQLSSWLVFLIVSTTLKQNKKKQSFDALYRLILVFGLKPAWLTLMGHFVHLGVIQEHDHLDPNREFPPRRTLLLRGMDDFLDRKLVGTSAQTKVYPNPNFVRVA